jgi:hypothetical protein
MTHHDVSSSFLTSAITAMVALLPEGALTYGGKVLSVFLLAAIAEVGRRLVAHIWERMKR